MDAQLFSLESISTCNTPPEIKSVQVREYGAEGLRTQEEEEGGETHKEQKGREARRQTNNYCWGVESYIFNSLYRFFNIVFQFFKENRCCHNASDLSKFMCAWVCACVGMCACARVHVAGEMCI